MKKNLSINIAIICHYKFRYTYELIDELRKYNLNVFPYAPKQSKSTFVRPTWGFLTYPLDITLAAIRDKINVVHIQFEFPTFKIIGSILMPILIFLLKISGKKIVITIHGPIFPLKKSDYIIKTLSPFKLPKILIYLIKFSIISLYILFDKLGAKLIVHANVFKKRLKEYGVNSCFVVPHGIKLNKNPISKDILLNGKYILYFGVLSPRKGIENLLMAVSFLKNELKNNRIKLIIAGESPYYYIKYKKQLKKICKKLQIDDIVQFIGYVNEDDVENVFYNAIVVVLPYQFSEAASGPLALAMEYKRPIIATATEYFREILGNEYLGLVKINNPLDLSIKLIEVINNEKLRLELIKYLEKRAINFSWSEIAKKTIKIYLDN